MLKRAEIERKGLGLSRRGKRSFKTDWHFPGSCCLNHFADEGMNVGLSAAPS